MERPVPTYDELAAAHPPRSSWDVFGRDDQLGTINRPDPERVVAAGQLIRTGHRFNLDYPVSAFEPRPTGTRPATQHHVFANNEFHRDDWLDSFYLQSTSQIDSLRHIGHPEYGFYNGLSAAENTDASTRLGIHNWAESGIAGRGVLLDVARFFAAGGREEYDCETTVVLDVSTHWTRSRPPRVRWHGGDLHPRLRTEAGPRTTSRSRPRKQRASSSIAATSLPARPTRGDPAVVVGSRDRAGRQRHPGGRSRPGARVGFPSLRRAPRPTAA